MHKYYSPLARWSVLIIKIITRFGNIVYKEVDTVMTKQDILGLFATGIRFYHDCLAGEYLECNKRRLKVSFMRIPFHASSVVYCTH